MIHITNAHQNNLKNIDLSIPEHQLIVVTGLSGSGKSSLAMGVIANEGYRYLLESLPQYNQQNSQLIPTAEVDDISDLPPVIKVEQSKRFQSINATFGTLSELTAVFRILFARYSTSATMSKSLFSFNHPKGVCEVCNGIGEEEYIDINKLIGDENLTLREGAITTTLPNGYITYSQVTVDELDKVCKAHDFNVDIPWKDLSEAQQDVVLNGSDRIKVFYGKHGLESRLKWSGIKAKPREEGYYKGMLPIMRDILKRDRNKNILRFVSSRVCPECGGARIKAEHLNYRWQRLNFSEWMDLPLRELYDKLSTLKLSEGEQVLVDQLNAQLFDLIRLGMGDYQLCTPSTAISSGDAQRIKLINQVNSNLQGILYVFDEPSIGLSENYQAHLLHILQRLIKRGNTVMVVEHDLAFIQAADWIIELGPEAGVHGGKLVFNGTRQGFLKAELIESPTLEALRDNEVSTEKPPKKLKTGAFQLMPEQLTVITKQSPVLSEKIEHYCTSRDLNQVVVSDQPIGKTPRSNPSTYTGLADKIRDLLAKTSAAQAAKLGKGAFSFNNKKGRCEACEGAGVITLSMNVMGNVNQVCPTCNGKRFKSEVLQVKWNGKNIADIYDLSIEQARDFFSEEQKVAKILALMIQLGLGYIKLGQPSNTLSGGEAQRIKLTKHFAKKTAHTLLVLEEPSIGLHHKNVQQLLNALHLLKRETAGIICFENHPLFQQRCDTLIDNETEVIFKDSPVIPDQERLEIAIKGANTHHLKNLDLKLPKHKLSVVTGISGSGKSSLVIDTLHGYGQQEMSKQFSSYQQSRVGVNFQFDVASINGLTPTICVTRKQKNYTDRSDIAKQTGIDKILRFAFSRKTHFVSVNSANRESHSDQDDNNEELTASHFSDNHELGKCIVCDGLGQALVPDLDKMVLDSAKSINEGVFLHNKALSYYGEPGGQYMSILEQVGKVHGFTMDTPWEDLSDDQKDIILNGADDTEWKATWIFKTKTREGKQEIAMQWEGINHYLQEEYFMTRKNKNIKDLVALFSFETCSACSGSGLKAERLSIEIGGQSIHAVKSMNFIELKNWLVEEGSEGIDRKLIENIRPHLEHTIQRAQQLHIDHLQLNRKSSTLSGGENQRVDLIKQLNSPLKGITYLLDEPSAGLSNDNVPDLIQLLQELIAKGNTVIVIEHNKAIIQAAEHLVEIGPHAGKSGGYITYQGKPQGLFEQHDCHPFLKTSAEPVQLRAGDTHIALYDLNRYALVRDKISIPVGGISAITGKSGVGKTTLVKDMLIPGINQKRPVNCSKIDLPTTYSGAHYFESRPLRAQWNTLLVDYLNLLKDITKIFAKETALKPNAFSYKTKSSQCPNCKGKGTIETSLDVAANNIEQCTACNGQRYKDKILSHTIAGASIADILNLNIQELAEWLTPFKTAATTVALLAQLEEIGLDHLSADQPVRSLSSGEQQRLLLLNWLNDKTNNQLYVLDEPSMGLHFADIDLLYGILEKLSEENDILVIEHNPYLLQKIETGMVLK
ncbi:MAG: ATP-binding cassette domain-containing protein [Bacteroidota bacterium]